MKTYLFVRNLNYRPSSYYRIYQYINENNSQNLIINEYESDLFYRKKSKKAIINIIYKLYFSFITGYLRRIKLLMSISTKKDYNIFVQREIFPRFVGPIGKYLLKKVFTNANKIYWDFDDNIFESNEISSYETKVLSKYVTKIIVGNKYLKNKIDSRYENKIQILNTTDKMMEKVDLELVNQRRLIEFDDKVILIWVGTKGNLVHLEEVVHELDQAALYLKNKDIILKVISDGELNISTKSLIVQNIKWERKLAFEEMLNAHIGLMPLKENEFTKGKCAFKAVQNIGCGLPIIVSNVGMNKEVIEDNGALINSIEEWKTAVINLSENKKVWSDKSSNSRNLWIKRFNTKDINEILSNVLDT